MLESQGSYGEYPGQWWKETPTNKQWGCKPILLRKYSTNHQFLKDLPGGSQKSLFRLPQNLTIYLSIYVCVYIYIYDEFLCGDNEESKSKLMSQLQTSLTPLHKVLRLMYNQQSITRSQFAKQCRCKVYQELSKNFTRLFSCTTYYNMGDRVRGSYHHNKDNQTLPC